MAKHPAAPVRQTGQSQAESSGFNGELKCASLADLIQLECLSGAREAVAVVSQGRKGHLFFEGGAMVHARTGTLIGHDAAFEILSWSRGTFSGSDLPWPVHNTITIPWQQLLMEAARRSDEVGRVSESQPSGMRSVHERAADSSGVSGSARSEPPSAENRHQGSVAPEPVRPALPARAKPRSGARPILQKPSLPPPLPTQSPAPALPASSTPASGTAAPVSTANAVSAVRRAVRFDDSGAILARRGDAEGLARLAPPLKHAIDALGIVLGLDHFRSFDATLSERRLMIYLDSRETYIALETTPGVDPDAVRAALND